MNTGFALAVNSHYRLLVMKHFRPIIVLVSAVCFGLGISLPLMEFEKLWFFSDTPSLIDIITGLWAEGENILALIVFAFSIVFPLLKLGSVFQTIANHTALSGWAASLAKWSMMDVLLVAIVIFAAKTSGLANAITQPGVWFYALSTVLANVATLGVSSQTSRKDV